MPRLWRIAFLLPRSQKASECNVYHQLGCLRRVELNHASMPMCDHIQRIPHNPHRRSIGLFSCSAPLEAQRQRIPFNPYRRAVLRGFVCSIALHRLRPNVSVYRTTASAAILGSILLFSFSPPSEAQRQRIPYNPHRRLSLGVIAC